MDEYKEEEKEEDTNFEGEENIVVDFEPELLSTNGQTRVPPSASASIPWSASTIQYTQMVRTRVSRPKG